MDSQTEKEISKLVSISDNLVDQSAKLEPNASSFGEDGEEFVAHISQSSRDLKIIVGKLISEFESNLAIDPQAVNPFSDQKIRHDIRNVIGSANGFSQLLLLDVTEGDLFNLLNDIYSSTQTFVEILDSFKAQALA